MPSAMTPFLVRAGIIGFGLLFGVFNVIHGFWLARKMDSLYNRFNCCLGSLILGVGFIVWSPVFFLFGDATWAVAIFVAFGATIALGAYLAGGAVRRERFLSTD